MKHIVHFSCGAASAVSALLTIMKYGINNVELLYTDPSMEHPDNHRFLADFEILINKLVTIIHSDKFLDPFDVFERRRFLSSPAGAPCTTELKKKTAQKYLGSRLYDEVNVFGFDCSKREQNRANRYKENNPLLKCWFPLIEFNIEKSDCFYILDKLGLKLPAMYKMGYANANCTGCVKASNIGYWSAIREDFPDIFNKYAKFERKIGALDENGERKGATINRVTRSGERVRVFLDEIPEDYPPQRNISFTCGYTCGAQDMEIQSVYELTKEPSLNAYIILQQIKEYLNNESTNSN